MKKVLAAILTAALMITAVPMNLVQAEPNEVVFTDLGVNHWAYDEVYELVERGVINGHPDGTFRPNDPVQADQFLKMILMVLSEEQEDGSRDWKDEFFSKTDLHTRNTLVHGSPGFDFKPGETNWAKPFIEQATNMNIVLRYDRWGGKFNQPLTREGVAYILNNSLRLFEMDEYQNYALLAETQIKDVDRAEHNIMPVFQVYTKGLMRGYANGTFGFEKTVTRAEAVITLYRLLDKSKRDPYQHDVSPLPHAKVQINHFGELEDRMVVFPSWDLKKGFDTIVEEKSKSKGIVEQNGIIFTFFRDQEQKAAEDNRTSYILGMFENPIIDMQVVVREDANYYGFFISTAEAALDNHKEALFQIWKYLFDEESDTFMSELESYRTKTRNGQFEFTKVEFNGRTVIAQPSNNDTFVRLSIGEKK